jgi:hypothetical protein
LAFNRCGDLERCAVTWTRLSCHRFVANAARLQVQALAYNPGNFLRTLAAQRGQAAVDDDATRQVGEDRCQDHAHGRAETFPMAEVMDPRGPFKRTPAAIAALRPLPSARC